MEMPARTYNEKFESFLKYLKAMTDLIMCARIFSKVFALHFMSMRLR